MKKRFYHYRINLCFYNKSRRISQWIVIDAPSKKIALEQLKKAGQYRSCELKWHLTGCPKHYILWLDHDQYHYDINKYYNDLNNDNGPF